MTRRIVRTLTQVVAFLVLIFFLIFVADTRYQLLPDRIHSALPSHHAGSVITDITISFCSTTNPFSSCKLDPEKWQRVEKDLYLRSGWVQSAWLHVQRRKEEELSATDRVVVGVKIGKTDPGLGERAKDGEHWESRPGGIWILRSSHRHDSDSDRAVTAVDVLFGPDAVEPRPNWKLADKPLLLNAASQLQTARLTTRQGKHTTVKNKKEIVPRVGKDGRFKILQVSDMHLATGLGACRDAIGENNAPSKNCDADPRTLEFLERILDEEKPNLVVLSGDQVEGPQSPDTQTTIFKFAEPLIKREIPYAAIFGNHDDEGSVSLSRKAQMALMETLPYSLSEAGPENIDGVGNYHVEVLAHSSHHSAITLYMLDSHSLTPDDKKYRGYDWIKQNQIDWFRQTSQSLKKEHAKYSHSHLDLAFIHIPIPEYAEKNLVVTGGSWKEGVTAPGFNSHFYDALVDEGVVAVGCGHDHVNDYCALRPPSSSDKSAKSRHMGPWMCYAGGSGFGGYAGYGGFHRRMRVWDVDANVGRVVTWKRVECCGEETKKRIDELVVVEGGRVVAPS